MFASGPVRARDLALAKCRLFESSDVEETRERIGAVMQPHMMSATRRQQPYRSHMDFLTMRGMGIGTIAFGEKTIEVPPLDNYYLLIFCLNGQACIRSDGGEVSVVGRRGIFVHDSEGLRGNFSEDCEQFVVRVDKRLLKPYCVAGSPAFDLVVDLNSPKLRPWLTVMGGLVSDAEAIRLVQEDEQVAADYCDLLIRLLMSGLKMADVAPGPRTACPRSVRRALAFVAAHLAEPLRLEHIALAADVPPRTLYDAFRRARGVSPMRHLRDLRLDRARARLLAVDESANVTSIAMEFGFGHLGRFAHDYAMRFGEKPSETLRRS